MTTDKNNNDKINHNHGENMAPNPPYRFGDKDNTPFMSDMDMLQASGASGAEIMAWAQRRVAAREERSRLRRLGIRPRDEVRVINEHWNGDSAAYDRARLAAYQKCVEELKRDIAEAGDDEEEFS